MRGPAMKLHTPGLAASIHPLVLLESQAVEFDGEVARAVESERPKTCARYPQDCADDDWGSGEMETCPYMKSRGKVACGWSP